MFRGSGDALSSHGFDQAVETASGYTVYFDRSWSETQGAEEAAYKMDVAFTGERLIRARITVQKGDRELIAISAARYIDIVGGR